MQYGADIKSFVKNNQKRKVAVAAAHKEEHYLRFILVAIAGMLISRVSIDINYSFIETLAPLGIVYVLAMSLLNIREGAIALIGSVIGYMTLGTKIEEMPLYVVMAIFAFLVTFMIGNKFKGRALWASFIMSFIVVSGFGILIMKNDLFGTLVVAGITTASIIFAYYIISYGIKCLDDFRTQHYFNNDEIISIELFISLIIVGIGSVSVFEVNIRDLVGVFFVLFVSFIGKGNLGATIGVILGAVFGMITGELTFYLAVFTISSLVATIFRETGRVISYISFNLTFILISLYLKSFDYYLLAELLIGSTAFLFIPKKIIETFKIEFDNDSKKDEYNQRHFNKMKNELSNRLVDFSEVLNTMGITLNTMVENEKLVDQNKAEALIDNLADRVCKNCDYKTTCWKREMHETYSSFRELIQSYEEGECIFPELLSKKCLKENTLIKATEEIVSKHIADEMLKIRLGEGRRLLSGHIKNMSSTISEIVQDFSREVVLSVDVERAIRKALLKNNKEFNDIIAYSDKEGRLNVKIEMEACSGTKSCVKNILPIINKTVGKNMSVCDECQIDPETKLCEMHIEEATKYHVTSAVSLCSKDGEKFTGDSYSFGKTKDGNHMVLLCDGMGTGPRAGAESKIAIEMVEKFSEVGFSERTAIDTVNSIMSIKFSEEEKFSTLDLQKINLYDGKVKFMKVGAMESFIKRGRKIKIIDSKTLPFGVVDTPDVDEIDVQLKGGDFVVTISDGILDLFKTGDLSNAWLVELLENSSSKNPNDLANEILASAKELTGGKAKDDMTVVVSKIYNLQ